jgi:hypothetical protein
MDAPGRRSRSGSGGARKPRRSGALIAALLALAALALPHPGAAQSPAATTKPPAANRKSEAPAVLPGELAQQQLPTFAYPFRDKCNELETTAATAGADLVFGAFQRGCYLTAFSLATQRAADRSDPKAMTLLGELYANGLGVPQDDKRAADWYKLAAARGDREAMFALAMFALGGRAGPRDREASAKWLAAAAKLGQPLAAYDLALLYMEGQLFPQDFGRAADLLRVAAGAGNAEAEYALGTLYKTGRGVPQDVRQAVHLFGLAALGDDVDAQVEYAIALYNGDGVARNKPAAIGLFHQAALKNNPVAQDRLAHVLASGQGAAADPVAATKWHLISKARGETDLALDDYVNSLDADTRAKGEQEAKTWLDWMKKKSPPS